MFRTRLRTAREEFAGSGDWRAIDDPTVQHKPAHTQIEAEVARWLAYRVTSDAGRG